MGDPKITKKPVGNDLREGKKSLPILMAMELANGKDKKIIQNSFGNPKVSKDDLKKAVEIICLLGIENSIRNQALRYAKIAEKALSKYPGSSKADLINLLDFVVKRSL
jgi:geranylgeranyl diphosphate synthase type I